MDSLQSAINAAKGGATRLELCSALNEGGLTPTPGLLKAVTAAVNIPVFCMLRVRGGNDFVYSSEELEAMKTDALLLRSMGTVNGFVFGALDEHGNVDIRACQDILQVTAPLPVTFHRAIDVCQDPLGAVQILVKLGFKRILTSGQKESALEGIPMIRMMVEKAQDQISIMVGAGIKKDNVAHILRATGAKEYHGSARVPSQQSNDSNRPKMGAADLRLETSVEEVAATVQAAQMGIGGGR